MAERMSDAGERLGRRNTLITFAVVAIVILGTVCLLKLAFRLPWGIALVFASTIMFAIWLVLLARSVRARRASGSVLVDCRFPARKVTTGTRLVLGASCGALAIWIGTWVVAAWVDGKMNEPTGLGLMCLAFTLLAIDDFFAIDDLLPCGLQLRRSCGLQLCQNGIWSAGSLLWWNVIQSYRWDGEDGLTLLIDYDSRFPLFHRRAILVPAEHKEKFDELLRQSCAAAE